LAHIHLNKFATKQHRSHQYLLNDIDLMSSEMQYTQMCHNQVSCVTSLNAIIIITNV